MIFERYGITKDGEFGVKERIYFPNDLLAIPYSKDKKSFYYRWKKARKWVAAGLAGAAFAGCVAFVSTRTLETRLGEKEILAPSTQITQKLPRTEQHNYLSIAGKDERGNYIVIGAEDDWRCYKMLSMKGANDVAALVKTIAEKNGSITIKGHYHDNEFVPDSVRYDKQQEPLEISLRK